MRIIINAIILVASIIFLVASVFQFREAFTGFNDLILHTGVIQEKDITEVKIDKTKRKIIRLTIQNNAVFVSSKYAVYIDDNLSIGDSVKIYTKPLKRGFGNSVINESGSSLWMTTNPNEIYHLERTKDGYILIDFAELQHQLRSMLWAFPLGSILFFGWFLYRRSGWKTPFIIESSD